MALRMTCWNSLISARLSCSTRHFLLASRPMAHVCGTSKSPRPIRDERNHLNENRMVRQQVEGRSATVLPETAFQSGSKPETNHEPSSANCPCEWLHSLD